MQNKESLQDKFKNFGAQPTDALWDSIASNLSNKRKKKAIWFWWFGAVASLGLILGTSLYFNEYRASSIKSSSNKTTLQNETVKIINNLAYKKSETQTKIEDINLALVLPIQSSSKTATTSRKPLQQTTTSTLHIIEPKHSIENTSPSTASKHIILNNEHDKLNCEDCNFLIKPRQVDQLTAVAPQHLVLNSKLKLATLKQPRQFEYSFNALTFFNINKEQQNYPLQSITAQSTSLTNEFSADESLLPNTQFNRSIPLISRLGIATNLSNRFKIQFGLDFGWIRTTSLNSDYYYQKSSNFTIGIPVFIKFNIINKRRFDFNANLGVINDFAILKQDKTYAYQKLQVSTFQATKGFLGGIETGVSFDYKLNEKLKLGIGTGVRWYYYQNYPGISSQKKNNAYYNVNLGLIWNY